jgi:hypothetical protein
MNKNQKNHQTKKPYQKKAKSDLYLQGWNYRTGNKQIKFLLANESNPAVRKVLKDMLRMKPVKYVRN